MKRSIDSPNGDFWGITSYYNPTSYERRLRNFRTFRERLNVPLVAVELSYGKTFDLKETDADILIQLHGRDVLWQKERLLNIALQHVPRKCEKIAWIDCDLIFGDSNWPSNAFEQMKEFPIVQLFERFYDVLSATTLDPMELSQLSHPKYSLAYKVARGTVTRDDFRTGFRSVTAPGPGLSGLAWAARRDVLEQHGLYDACIIGNGDKAMTSAMFGRFDDALYYLQMNRSQATHYLAWAEPYHDTVHGKVGYVPGTIYHQWHGDLSKRKHQERHREFKRFNFNPYLDIALDRKGIWRWNSDKLKMHQYLNKYFEFRDDEKAER